MNKIRGFVLRLRNLPEQQKQIILFTIIAVSAVVLLFLNIKSTKNTISKIGESVKSVNLQGIDFNTPNSNLQNNGLESEVGMPDTEINNVTSSQSGNIFQNQNSDWSAGNGSRSDADWQTYKNELYGFTIDYPKDWSIDESHTTNLDIWLEKKVEKEVADIHIEVASQTQSIKSTQEGMDYIISQMKDIVKPKEKIGIETYEAYEVIGTICTSICTGSPDDTYFPFSVIYLSNKDTVIKIKYGEGTLDIGWKNTIENWKYYDEYKKIISTISFNTL